LANFRWPAPEGYYEFANRNVMVIIIIENVAGVENIEEIAATPGIDAIFIGTNDLSFSLGVGGERRHPKVQEAVQKVVAAARRRHVPLGLPVATPEQMDQGLKEGFLLFQAPTEMVLLSSASRAFLDPLGKKGIDPKTQPMY
jgi:2-keto-3-deoxy-L-rhamnonate aldolase RhmA